MLRAGDPAELVARPAGSVTVAEVLAAYYERDAAVIRRMLAVPGHSARWDDMAAELCEPAADPAAATGAGH
jgi:MOSC domain-containing protein YiiM